MEEQNLKLAALHLDEDDDRYHLLLTLTFGRRGIIDIATMVVDGSDNFKSIDGGDWQFYMNPNYGYSTAEVDAIIASKLERFRIRTAWVYGDNRYFRELRALRGIQRVYNLRKGGMYRNTSPAITDMKRAYRREEGETPEEREERERVKLIIDLATYLIAGYDAHHEVLYTEDFINPKPCFRHQRLAKGKRGPFCASTLILINRLTLIFLSKQITREEVETITDSLFQHPHQNSNAYYLSLEVVKNIMSILGFDAEKYRIPLDLV